MNRVKYTENPTVDFRKVETIETEDAAAFAAFVEGVAPETPVAWFSHKDDCAHPGAWVRRGMYRLKHGSFVDPVDLSCYAAQYYEPFASGRHECVQIGRTPETMAMPDDVTPTPTAGDLAAAIRTLAEVPAAIEVGAENGENAVEAAAAIANDAAAENAEVGEATETVAAPADEAAPVVDTAVPTLKLLQPDYAFEFHGALTRGWHAQLYAVETEEGEAQQLLVLR